MNKSELINSIEAKQLELKNLFASHKDANGEFKMSPDVLAEAESREVELKGLNESLAAVKKLENIQKSNESYFEANAKSVNRLPFEAPEAANATASYKSFGTQIVESGALKNMNAPGIKLPGIDVKTLMSTGAGFAPRNDRSNVVALSPTAPLTILDYINPIYTSQNAYKFMLETTFTNSAAATAQSVQGTLASYPESALAFTETTVDIRKIATFLPVTDEQLADSEGVRDLLDSRLAYMIKAALQSQVVAGDGNAPNIRGLINTSGVNTQAKGSDSVFDAIYKGITLIRVNGQTEPDLILVHPNDWQDIRITQNTTGQYLWESASLAGAMTMFGIPVLLSTHVTEGTAVLLNSNEVALVVRQDVEVAYSNSHASYFVQGVQAVRADIRAGLAVFKPKAICTVTGI